MAKYKGKYFNVSGIKEIQQKLQTMEESVRKKHLVSVAKQSGKIIIEDAQNRVRVKTGNLRDSIGVETFKGKGPKMGLIGVGPRRKKGKPGWQGWHGWLVEHGTSGRRKVQKKKVLAGNGKIFGKEVAPMPKNPFMRPAWYAKGQATSEDYQKRLAKRILKASKK
jgi:HK97 gp10 family phage protein